MLGTLGLIKGQLRALNPQKYTEENFKPGVIPETHDNRILCKVYSCSTNATLKEEPIFGEVDANTFDLDLRYKLLLYEGSIYYCYNPGINKILTTTNSDYIDMSKDCSNYYTSSGYYTYLIRQNGQLWTLYKDSSGNWKEFQIGTDTDWKMVSGVSSYMYDSMMGNTYITPVLAIKGNSLVRITPTANDTEQVVEILQDSGDWIYVVGSCNAINKISACICVKKDGSVYAYNPTDSQLKLVGTITGTIKEFKQKIAINTDNTLNLMWDTNVIRVANSTIDTPWIQFTDFGDTDGGYYALNKNGILYRLSYGGGLSSMVSNCTGVSGVWEYFLHCTMYIQNGDIYIGGSNSGNTQNKFYKKTTTGDFVRGWGGSWMYPTFVLRKI